MSANPFSHCFFRSSSHFFSRFHLGWELWASRLTRLRLTGPPAPCSSPCSLVCGLEYTRSHQSHPREITGTPCRYTPVLLNRLLVDKRLRSTDSHRCSDAKLVHAPASHRENYYDVEWTCPADGRKSGEALELSRKGSGELFHFKPWR